MQYHTDEIRHQHGRADGEDRCALHVESRQAFEAREAEEDTKQRDADGTGAESRPEPGAQPLADRPGDADRDEREYHERAGDEGHDRRETAAMLGVHGRPPFGLRVIRFS